MQVGTALVRLVALTKLLERKAPRNKLLRQAVLELEKCTEAIGDHLEVELNDSSVERAVARLRRLLE